MAGWDSRALARYLVGFVRVQPTPCLSFTSHAFLIRSFSVLKYAGAWILVLAESPSCFGSNEMFIQPQNVTRQHLL